MLGNGPTRRQSGVGWWPDGRQSSMEWHSLAQRAGPAQYGCTHLVVPGRGLNCEVIIRMGLMSDGMAAQRNVSREPTRREGMEVVELGSAHEAGRDGSAAVLSLSLGFYPGRDGRREPGDCDGRTGTKPGGFRTGASLIARRVPSPSPLSPNPSGEMAAAGVRAGAITSQLDLARPSAGSAVRAPDVTASKRRQQATWAFPSMECLPFCCHSIPPFATPNHCAKTGS